MMTHGTHLESPLICFNVPAGFWRCRDVKMVGRLLLAGLPRPTFDLSLFYSEQHVLDNVSTASLWDHMVKKTTTDV